MSKGTVLIIDDMSTHLLLLQTILDEEGYHTITYSDPIAAIKELYKGHIDIMLLDIMMPGMDGYALLKWIRNNKELEGIPVVFLTARADHNMKIEGLELGAIDYVTKPFSSDELLMRIRNQVEFKKLRDFALRNYNISLIKLNQ